MSGKYKKVKGYYNSGFWTENMLKNAVKKGWITEEEYKEIVGGKNDKSERSY